MLSGRRAPGGVESAAPVESPARPVSSRYRVEPEAASRKPVPVSPPSIPSRPGPHVGALSSPPRQPVERRTSEPETASRKPVPVEPGSPVPSIPPAPDTAPPWSRSSRFRSSLRQFWPVSSRSRDPRRPAPARRVPPRAVSPRPRYRPALGQDAGEPDPGRPRRAPGSRLSACLSSRHHASLRASVPDHVEPECLPVRRA